MKIFMVNMGFNSSMNHLYKQGALYKHQCVINIDKGDVFMGKVNLQVAKEIIAAAEKQAEDIGVKMVISVLDEGGNLIATHRMDDAWLASIDIAQNKAWTSVALKMPTSNLAEATVPNAELYGLNTTNQGKIVVFGGGFPLEKDDKVIGAIGVSGSSVENDTKVSQAGVDAFEKMNL